MQTIEQQITNIIQDTLMDLGFEVVKVTLRGSGFKVLEILIDRLDTDKITVKDCRTASKNISALLDVEDVISDKYLLEVSSAGIERPLVKFEDYIRFANREVSIKLKELLNGQSRYQGKILKAEDNKIYLHIKGRDVVIDFVLVKNATLVFTDEMFQEMLKKPHD